MTTRAGYIALVTDIVKYSVNQANDDRTPADERREAITFLVSDKCERWLGHLGIDPQAWRDELEKNILPPGE